MYDSNQWKVALECGLDCGDVAGGSTSSDSADCGLVGGDREGLTALESCCQSGSDVLKHARKVPSSDRTMALSHLM